MTELNENAKEKLETILRDLEMEIEVRDSALKQNPARLEEVRLYSKVKKGPSHSVKQAYVSVRREVETARQAYADIRDKIYEGFPELRKE